MIVNDKIISYTIPNCKITEKLQINQTCIKIEILNFQTTILLNINSTTFTPISSVSNFTTESYFTTVINLKTESVNSSMILNNATSYQQATISHSVFSQNIESTNLNNKLVSVSDSSFISGTEILLNKNSTLFAKTIFSNTTNYPLTSSIGLIFICFINYCFFNT